MSAWFRDDVLLEESVKIAIDFLDRTGEIDDLEESCQFLVSKVGFMIAQGQRKNYFWQTAPSQRISVTGEREPSSCRWFRDETGNVSTTRHLMRSI